MTEYILSGASSSPTTFYTVVESDETLEEIVERYLGEAVMDDEQGIAFIVNSIRIQGF